MRPLEGLIVVAVEQAVAAPFCSSRLADAGAHVIKVERPEGDFARGYDAAAKGQSSYFVWLNRGKDSVVINLATTEGRASLEQLIASADVLIQNLKPGAMDKLGFTRDRLRADYPKLICCTITGYGDDGPYAHRKAYDLLIQAESGLASITGGPDGPSRVGVSIVDVATGATAHASILEALVGRARTGQGADIRISMFDVMADWLTVPLLNAEAGNPPKRMGLAHPSIAPYGVFRSIDGKDILISIQSEREWKILCAKVLGDAALASDPRLANGVERVRNRAVTDQIVGDIFGALSRDELLQRLTDADIAFAEVNTMADLTTHPHLRSISVDTPNGVVTHPAPAAIFVGQPRSYHAVPAIGEAPSKKKNMTAFDLDHLRSWIGRSEASSDIVTAQLTRALRATLFLDIGKPQTGDIAPYTAHWCLAQPVVPMAELGPDGHPARGGFLPPVPLPRRMWAGGELQFLDTLRVGDEVTRTSTIKDVTMKTGSTGALCFVAVEHLVTTPRGTAIRERQDIVYRDMPAPGQSAPPAPTQASAPSAQHRETHMADAVLLFRYSALTFNGHRIHYDRDYVTKVEGYPGLVFHGPMQAALLVEFAARLKGAAPKIVSYRGVQPLFDGGEFSVNANKTPEGLDLWTANARGEPTMKATASW